MQDQTQPVNQKPAAIVDPMQQSNYVFKFLSYYFDKKSLTGTFVYQGIDNTIFTEKITFAKHPEAQAGKFFNATDDPSLNNLLDRAMFLAFMLLGSSYYKAHPTPYIEVPKPIDDFQAKFFNKVYQEGLSQYAFENGLTRENLAHFTPSTTQLEAPIKYNGKGLLSLQSGGKDSLLVATLLLESRIDFTPWYVSSDPDGSHPAVIDELFPQLLDKKASIAIRQIDKLHLQQSGGLNGHVPVTFINTALGIIQAILNNQNIVMTSIGNEGAEAHAYINDLPVNHQWSKTWEAEQLLAEYVKRYISEDIKVGSPIRKYSELRIAELFVNKCWQRYGYKFSSCNQANYKQGTNNSQLSWCGECAKCANTYILFSPFLAPQSLQTLFHDVDLFQKPTLINIFKGLLGIDNVMKPFECIGSVDELRFAYHHRMKVPPIEVPQNTNTIRNYQTETINANLVQASERLGIRKLFKQNPQPAVPTYNPNGNNGQYGDAYASQKPTETVLVQPIYSDLPFMVPESRYNYAAEHESQEFFKNFFEENRK